MTAKFDIQRWINSLDEDAREFFEERAGIREYMGEMTRDQAELLAAFDTKEYMRNRDRAGRSK